MRKQLALIAFTSVLAFGTAWADATMTKGQVTKVDEGSKKITIDHGPIKKLDMDAMTMAFVAGDSAMLTAVKAGDKVEFHVEKINGLITITKIEKTK